MHSNYSTLVELGDRYTLVKQAPVLDAFVVFLLIFCFAPFLVVLVISSVIKGRGVVRKPVLSSWLTRIGTCMLI